MTADRPEESKAPLILFYSYAHTDEPLRNELEKHLSSLQRRGTITGWHDRKIGPGSYWATDIDTSLNSASIILLLVSPDFLASDYCSSVEMRQALTRHENGAAHVIPIILRPVDWQEEPIGHLQALPYNAKPITTWSNQDEAFLDVVRGIREVVNRIQTRSVLVSLPSEEKQSREAPPDVYHWEEGGALSEHVGSLARNNQWAQAEAAARQITDSQKRSLVLHKLVNALAQSEQWERAEAVARSIENQQYKQQALTSLANELIETQQWERAADVTNAVFNPSERSRLLRQLSQGMAGDEKRGSQALYFAYRADQALEQPEGLPMQPSLGAPPPRAYRRVYLRVGCQLLIVALVFVITLLTLLLTRTLTGTLYFLLWGLVGIISICIIIYIIIRVISFIRDTWFW